MAQSSSSIVGGGATAVAALDERPQVERLARQQYEWEGRPEGRETAHWLESELMVRWKAWARQELRPYLAHQASEDADGVADRLGKHYSRALDHCAVLMVCLDGAPERSRYLYDLWRRNNGYLLPPVIDEKDSVFYSQASSVLAYYGATIVDQPAGNEDPEPSRRMFQDACVAVFEGAKAVHQALVVAFRMHRELAAYNEDHALSYEQALCPRTSIATRWHAAVRCMPRARRDDIVIGRSAFLKFKEAQSKQHPERLQRGSESQPPEEPQLITDCQELLIAAGVKIIRDD